MIKLNNDYRSRIKKLLPKNNIRIKKVPIPDFIYDQAIDLIKNSRRKSDGFLMSVEMICGYLKNTNLQRYVDFREGLPRVNDKLDPERIIEYLNIHREPTIHVTEEDFELFS